MRLMPLLAVVLFATPALAAVKLPADLSGYFSRLKLCTSDHSSPTTSEARDDQLLAEKSNLLCKQLPAEKKAMQKKYASNADYMELLNSY